MRRNERIERKAEEILQQTYTLDSLPIDPKSIAKALGLAVIMHDLEGDVSGILILKDGKGTIGVNKDHHEVRQRFTIAHEIGHYVLEHERTLFVDKSDKHTVIYRDQKSSTGEDRQERQANAFAAALLMPAVLIEEKVKGRPFSLTENRDDSLINFLAKEFEVSTEAMAYRLVNLGYLNL